MKNLFGIVLSLQLMIAPLALAEDYVPPGGSETSETGGASGGTSGGATGASAETPAGQVGLRDEYVATGTGSKGGYDFYVNQIMSLATTSIGASIITQCLEGLKTPSIATFMAGSLTHIMSEILGAKAKNERHQKKRKDLEIKVEELKKSGDSAQLEALKVALQEEKDTQKFLENRKKWMIAVTAIYSAAMGLAIAEEIYGIATRVTASAAGCNAFWDPICASATIGAGACIAANVPVCMTTINTTMEGLKANTLSHFKAREMFKVMCAGPSYVPCMEAGEAEMALVYAACQPAPVDGGASMMSWTTLLSLGYGFAASTAGAKQGKISQYGSMLITLMPLITKSFGTFVSQMYNFPIPRSITFGAAAVFSGTVTAGLASRSNKAMQNVTKLQNAVYQFKVETEGGGSGIGLDVPTGGGTGSNATGGDPKLGNIKKLAEGKKRECFSRGSKGMELSSGGCANPIKIGKFKPGQFKLASINHVAGLSADMAQALANGDEAAAANMAGEIGQYAARVKAETAKLQEKYNEIQKKDKRPTTDFDKSIKAQVASLQGEMNKAAASKGVSLAEAGAALSEDEMPTKEENVPEVKTADAPAAPEVPVDPLAGLNTDVPEEPITDGVTASTKKEQSLDDFESSEQDINKKSDVSIFKQLSNRYILNYTKMFDRKKNPAVAEEPKKN